MNLPEKIDEIDLEEVNKPDPSVLLAVNDAELMECYMAFIDRNDPGCPVFQTTSLSGLSVLYRALDPNNLTIYVATSAKHDEISEKGSGVLERIKSDISQGSPVRMVEIEDLPTFEQCLMNASLQNNVYTRYMRTEVTAVA